MDTKDLMLISAGVALLILCLIPAAVMLFAELFSDWLWTEEDDMNSVVMRKMAGKYGDNNDRV